jgi:cytochrome c oxidase subunit 2
MNEILRAILFLPSQSSTIAREVDQLHYFVIGSTFAGAVLVTLIGGWFLFRYRRGARWTGGPRNTSKVRRIEVTVWVGIFGLFILFWIIGARQFMRIRVPPEGAMEIYVTGKQWMWSASYPGGGGSNGNVVVPVGRPIKLILTSRDVIHSFFVPEFRIKQDLVPGRYTTAWFEATQAGTYPILCTEYCGAGHSTMRGTLIALSPPDYERWLRGPRVEAGPWAQTIASPTRPLESALGPAIELARLGQAAAAEYGCLKCHTLDGTPHIGPTWAGLYRSMVPLEQGGEVRADEAYLTESMMDPLAKMHRGFSSVMPSYQGRIHPPEVAAILELIRALSPVPEAPPAPAGGKP